MSADILKIQESIRKSIATYAIKSKHKEEALVALVSVDLYLSLSVVDAASALKSKGKAKSPDIPKDTGAPMKI